jgi:hypothetical protein
VQWRDCNNGTWGPISGTCPTAAGCWDRCDKNNNKKQKTKKNKQKKQKKLFVLNNFCLVISISIVRMVMN